MALWRRRQRGTPSTRARRGRFDPPDKEQERYMSAEQQIIERLQRMKLPEPPPGAKERAMKRYHEWLRQQGRQKFRD